MGRLRARVSKNRWILAFKKRRNICPGQDVRAEGSHHRPSEVHGSRRKKHGGVSPNYGKLGMPVCRSVLFVARKELVGALFSDRRNRVYRLGTQWTNWYSAATTWWSWMTCRAEKPRTWPA